jgi:hypothetical protein
MQECRDSFACHVFLPSAGKQRWFADEADIFHSKFQGSVGNAESVILQINMVGHAIDYIDCRVSFEERDDAGDSCG